MVLDVAPALEKVPMGFTISAAYVAGLASNPSKTIAYIHCFAHAEVNSLIGKNMFDLRKERPRICGAYTHYLAGIRALK